MTDLNVSPGWDRQRFPKSGDPFCWLQWKGSQVCMDFQCACGFHGHIDREEFAYYVKCPMCKATYMLNAHIECVKLTDAEIPHVSDCVIKIPARD